MFKRCLGYADDHPVVVKAHKDLKDFYIREGDSIRLQPCVSPVWDTGIALHALAEAGLPPASDAAERGTAWLRSKEVRVASDWQRNVRPDRAERVVLRVLQPALPRHRRHGHGAARR